MNKKVYKTLEYNKILTMLSSYAACDETKKRCLSLEPITDLYEIRHLQTTTADALSRLYKDSGISFVGIHNVHASLKRLDIGGALNTTELLRICSLLEVAKRVKAYGRSAMDNEKQDSLSDLFAGRVLVNGKAAKAGTNVKPGDRIDIQFGNRETAVEVVSIAETVKKDEAADLYKFL